MIYKYNDICGFLQQKPWNILSSMNSSEKSHHTSISFHTQIPLHISFPLKTQQKQTNTLKIGKLKLKWKIWKSVRPQPDVTYFLEPIYIDKTVAITLVMLFLMSNTYYTISLTPTVRHPGFLVPFNTYVLTHMQEWLTHIIFHSNCMYPVFLSFHPIYKTYVCSQLWKIVGKRNMR